MSETHLRVTINVSREDRDPDLVELARVVNDALEPYDLGATLSRTIGIWEGAIEQGVEVKIVYPKIVYPTDTEPWKQNYNDAVEDALFSLRVALPTQKYFQVEREQIWMGEWNTATRRYTSE